MKVLIQFYTICILMALLPMCIMAQDGRQRDYKTIIVDGLAQLPISNPQKRNKVMAELTDTGAKGIEMLAKMLVPAEKGKNAIVEYAISGVVGYVTIAGNDKQRKNIREGLATSIDFCTDNANRTFLLSQLQYCSTAEDATLLIKYLKDPHLAEAAIRALVATPGTDEIILDLMYKETVSKKLLAHAAYERKLTTAEPILLKWLKNADKETSEIIYTALSACGSSASLKVLSEATKTEAYKWNKNQKATSAYLALLNRLANSDEKKKVIKAGKKLLKNGEPYLYGAALDIILKAENIEGMPYVYSALKDERIEVRNSALQSVSSFANDQVYATIAQWIPSLSEDAHIDIINWFGSRHTTSQINTVIEAIQSKNDFLAISGINAAGRIGGEKALNALITQLGGKHANKASSALLTFNGNIEEGIKTALKSQPAIQIQALKLCSKRRINGISNQIFSMLQSENEEIKNAAYNALPNIVTFTDFERLTNLIANQDIRYTGKLQEALKNSIKSQSPKKQYEIVASYITKSSSPAIYYPIVAQTNTIEAISLLSEEFSKKNANAAFKALLKIDHPEMVELLYQIAWENKSLKDQALSRYSSLVSKSTVTNIRKYQLYRQALELDPSVKVQEQILKALSSIPIFPSLILASKYLDKDETCTIAAATVKTIVAKNKELLGGNPVKDMLKKAQAIYKTLSDADAGYAIDEITNLLSKLPTAEYSPLFDGTMSNWNTKANINNWKTSSNSMSYLGNRINSIQTQKDYENFEMYLEWKTTGEAGISIRSIPEIGIGTKGGSGALLGNKIHPSKPLVNADNKAGEWNTLYAKVVDDRVTIIVNGQTVARNTILENSISPTIPAYIKGKIELTGKNTPVEFRDLYIRELPPTPIFTLSSDEKAKEYEILFDGSSLHKWTGNTHSYITENGTIYVEANYGKGGNLYTKKEYSDFILRFEFCFEREGVNNGIGIRTPIGVDAAYHGMEIQILDHDSPIYKGLHEHQQHGSVYGIIPAKRIKFGSLGTWNTEEIRAVGDHITVTVNGQVILDGNIREACKGHNISEDGSNKNPYTVDHRNHPGLFNKKGHIGLCGHGAGIRFRNIRILDLDSQKTPSTKK